MPKPFPLYTDGSNLYTTFDGGATLITLESAGGLVQTSAPVSGDGSVGNKITIAAAALPLTALATQANNTALINVSGGAASPVAGTATQLTALINPATGSLPGAMSAAQASVLANATGGLVELAYVSAAVDLLTVAATQVVPAAPSGFAFCPVRVYMVMSAITGTATSPPAVQLGNNSATYNNVVSSSAIFPSDALANAGAGSETNAAIPSYVLSGAAYFVNVTGAVVGPSVCSARYIMVGYWHPLP